MTLYGIFRFLHVAVAIAAMGPHFAAVLMLRHMARHPESVPALYPVLGRIGNLPKHGAMAMLVTGMLMVAFNPAGFGMFKELWLAASLLLFFAVMGYGMVRMEPITKEMGAVLAAGPVRGEQVIALAKRADAAFQVMTLGLVAIIVLMIFRPTL